MLSYRAEIGLCNPNENRNFLKGIQHIVVPHTMVYQYLLYIGGINMKHNLSTPQAYIRICTGVTLVGFAISRISKKPSDMMGCMLLCMGGMSLADGILKWCPLKQLISNKRKEVES
jgi:hypothetical protein